MSQLSNEEANGSSGSGKVKLIKWAIIIAGVAEQIPDVEHKWDPASDSFHEPEADKLVWSHYRAGWELEGLGKGA